ncbi:MAG: LPS assembly protein LptD [Alphaproteobacteria bacterium]
MKKINAYITKQLLLGFVLILIGMTALIWLSQSLRMIDWIVNKGVSVNLFVELTLLVLPNFITIITPIAFFVVLLFVYSRLLSDKELVVMKACGMSAWDLARPAFFTAGILSIVGYVMTLWLVPYSVSRFKELQFKIRNNLAQVVIQEGEFNPVTGGVVAYVRVFKPNGELEGIFIHDDRNPKERSVMVAKSGLYVMGEGQAQIILYNGTHQKYNRQKEIFSSMSFEKNVVSFEENRTNKVRTLTEAELPLRRLISVKPEELTELQYRKYKVEAIERLIQPLYAFTYLFVALLSLLLGFYNRRGQSSRIYVAVLSVVILQCLSLSFENLSNKNLIFIPFIFLNAFLPILIGTVVLKRGYWLKKTPKLLKRFFLVLFLCLFSFNANATAQFITDTEFHKDAPVDFEADLISYDQNNGIITAQGNVVLTQQGTTVKADKLVFNQKTQQGEAVGNVVIIRPDGVEIKSEKISLSDAFNEAQLEGIVLTFADGSTFKAKQIIRSDEGNETTFKTAFFTPCTYCENQSPLWDLRASTVEHNFKEKEYTFYNALLNIKGFPVFYFPYFEYPDFQVKRKTGFLAPSLSRSTEMGFGIETPFFLAINDSQDLWLNPYWSTTHIPLIQAKYRGIYDFSKFVGNVSFTKRKDDKHSEGHILLNYEADFTDSLRFTGQYYRVSNDTYLRRYPIDGIDDQSPWITSLAKMEYYGDESYGYARVMDFESMRRYIPRDSMPLVSTLNYTYTSKPFWNGLYSVSTLNGADVYRKTNEQMMRLSYEQSFVLPYISSSGFAFENKITGRFDGFNTKQDDNESRNISRFYMNASSKISYPLMQVGSNYSQVIEPIAMAVWSPNIGTKKNIPNEDCVDVLFDDVNLFSANRYNGYDRVETGSRLNYGLKWSLYGPNNMYLSAMLGQSYRFSNSQNRLNQDGFDKHFSAYVGHLNMDFKDFGVGYRFRFSKDKLEHEMSEARVYAGRDPLRISVSYLYLKASEELIHQKALKDREEIYFHVSSKLNQNWSTYGYYRYDLAEDGGPTEEGLGIQYDNECLTLMFTVEKDLTRDLDYKGDTSYFIRAVFKTLGSV